MHTAPDLIYLLVLLVAIVVAVSVFQRLGLGIVLGYLAAGIAVGPWGIGFIHDLDMMQTLGEFGVIFLLFMIGIEMKPSRLWLMRDVVFGLGATQVFVMGALMTGLAFMVGLSFQIAFIVGFAFSLSSTAMGLQTLSEQGELHSRFGRTAFSILLFEDLAAIPLLSLVALFAAKQVGVEGEAGLTALKMVGVLVGVIIGGRYLLRPLLRFVAKSKSSEAFSAVTVLLILFTAWIMTFAGLPMALGAFLAGVLMSESEYRHQIQVDMLPFKSFLLGFFFMTVGMMIDFSLLWDYTTVVLAIVCGLIVFKIIFIWGLCRLTFLSHRDALKVGLLLSQGGEFAFIIFQMASGYGLMAPELANIFILSVALSMFFSPFIFRLGSLIKLHDGRLAFDSPREKALSALTAETTLPSTPHILIAGFGRVGQTIARMLTEQGVSYTALDMEPDRVAEGRKAGFSVYYGDSSRLDVLKAIGAERAQFAVLTLDRTSVIEKTVQILRAHFPSLHIYARARNQMESHVLQAKGATMAIPETIESSLQLGRVVLSALHVPSKDIDALIRGLRHDDYAALQKVIPAVTVRKRQASSKKLKRETKKLKSKLKS